MFEPWAKSVSKSRLHENLQAQFFLIEDNEASKQALWKWPMPRTLRVAFERLKLARKHGIGKP
jgi:hypothetical protein